MGKSMGGVFDFFKAIDPSGAVGRLGGLLGMGGKEKEDEKPGINEEDTAAREAREREQERLRRMSRPNQLSGSTLASSLSAPVGKTTLGG